MQGMGKYIPDTFFLYIYISNLQQTFQFDIYKCIFVPLFTCLYINEPLALIWVAVVVVCRPGSVIISTPQSKELNRTE